MMETVGSDVESRIAALECRRDRYADLALSADTVEDWRTMTEMAVELDEEIAAIRQSLTKA